jgi:hypothetical protein
MGRKQVSDGQNMLPRIQTLIYSVAKERKEHKSETPASRICFANAINYSMTAVVSMARFWYLRM